MPSVRNTRTARIAKISCLVICLLASCSAGPGCKQRQQQYTIKPKIGPGFYIQEGMTVSDTEKAINLLANAGFDYPADAKVFWEEDDGLPEPNSPDFPQKAARFLAEHPVIPATELRVPSLWDTRTTSSRQCKCLAYLAGGKKEARREVARLCITQALRLQWTLPIRANHTPTPDRTFFAGAGAHSLTGGILRNGSEKNSPFYETATQWMRTGTGLFETYGHKGSEQHRKAAAALISATGVKIEELKSDGSVEAFFRQIDLNRPDMTVVAKYAASGDWQRAQEAYVDVLSERFSTRHGWPNVNLNKTVDIPEADDICRNIFILKSHMYRRYDFGEKVDWARVIDDDIESRVWMNAHPWMTILNNAYQKTGDQKYLKHLCRLFNSWYEDSPPTFERTDAQWRTLELGTRTSRVWCASLLTLSENPVFKRESLFNMARSMLDHGKYLCAYSAGHGNWLQVESSGLANIAMLFPEFKLSPHFYWVAMERLSWANAWGFLPDGFQSECSTTYHSFPLSAMANALRFAKFLDVPLPENLMEQYESGVNVLHHMSYPDGTLPTLNDTGPGRGGFAEISKTGTEVFGRDDFRWFATGGREGSPPTQTSYDFTHAGYCVMRDKWGADGQVLIFDAGHYGTCHQHEDKLNFVYYAGGRELIGDPGIYSYNLDEFLPYWRGTWSHNTITIDELSQDRGLGPEEDVPDPDRRFVMGDGFDYAVGWYRRSYAPRGAQIWEGKPFRFESDSKDVVRSVQHQRCIFYLKGRYAVICDRVLGEGEHQIDIIYHPAPITEISGAERKIHAPDIEINDDGVVVTKEQKHANVAIIPAQSKGIKVLDLIGQKKPVRGWFSLWGIRKSHDIIYRCRSRLPRHFETLIQPLPAGDAAPMVVRSLQVESGQKKTCAGLSCGDDLFLISYDGPAQMSCGDVVFHGSALLLIYNAKGEPERAYMVDGKSLMIGDKQVFATDTPAPAHTIDISRKTPG
ncbi:MAG: alginate lyase family protein [Planctomycetota bacterium]